jgi:hypothetical protein
MTVDLYAAFLAEKSPADLPSGLPDITDALARLPAAMKPFQRDITGWALRRGRAAMFEGTGLGKTVQQLAWGREVAAHEQGQVLLLTPLAVAEQTISEAEKFGIPGVSYAGHQDSIKTPITVTNYDRLHHFRPDDFAAVILDESSIIKSHDSATRATLIEAFKDTAWKLACSATPAPNDYVELGNHSEFLGVMTQKEMLSMFFVHDGSVRAKADGHGEWRLKRHAEKDFWRWLASWAVVIRHPGDLGYDEPGYDLPPLHRHQINVSVPYAPTGGLLFPMEARTMRERIGARKDSLADRVAAAARIVNAQPDRPWLVWCNLNSEADALVSAIPNSVQVRGSDTTRDKTRNLMDFSRGDLRVLVTKPSIAGWGLNFQRCADMVFVGLNDSFEQLFQAIRRCWRFGQTRPVNVYLIASELEGAVVANLENKEREFDAMGAAMVEHMRELSRVALRQGRVVSSAYAPMVRMEVPEWLTAA